MALDQIILEGQAQEWANKCAEYSKEHGKENPQYLFEYGKALFAIAKHNSSLVDSQKMEEKQMPLENPKVKIANFEEQEYEEEEEEPAEQPAEESGEKIETEGGEEQEAPVEEEEGEDDDFVAAFQIIDLVRVIYEKEENKTKETKEKLARARELLGDISLEDDNAPQAIEDYLAAVQLKREIFGNESAEVSEAEFMLSLAYDAAGQPSNSLEHLKKAAATAKLAKMPSADELSQRAKDMEADLRASEKMAGKDTQQAKQTTQESITGRQAIANAVQSIVSNANDISQLARKRKREDKPAAGTNSDPPAKSAK